MHIDRRALLEGGAALSFMMALGGCETLIQQIQNRPRRRDLATMNTNHPVVQAYRDAVGQMKSLPNSDPRNWTRQAEIHQNFCPHGNWFFFPWHRAYLLSFERICQNLLNDPNFGLPYWNWACQRRVPAPFWGEANNPLFHSPRLATPTSEADPNIFNPQHLNDILSETDFELFASGAATELRPPAPANYGLLEGGPHNYVHGFVGGTMGGYMSPLDPVFWTHHNVIDYYWFEWNSRGNANTNDPVYTNFDIAGHMVDGAGNPVDYRVGSLILAPLLSYKFVPPGPCGPLRFAIEERAWLRDFLEQGADIRFKPSATFEKQRGFALAVGEPVGAELNLPREAMPQSEAADTGQRLLLRISDVNPPDEEDFYVQVYFDLSENERPTIKSPSYAGSFAFFVDRGAHGGHRATHNYYVDLDRAVQKLRAARRDFSPSPKVTLVARPVEEGRKVRNPVVEIGGLQPLTISRRAVPEVDDDGIIVDNKRVFRTKRR